MHPLIKANIKRAKLAYLWITRILLAPNRFGVSFPTRIRYAVGRGFVPDQVALYGLTRARRHEYLSEFDWYRSRWINEPFDAMLNNKIVCNEILQAHDIDVPRIHVIKNKGRIVAPGTTPPMRSARDVLPLLERAGSLFLRPIAGGKGKDVRRLDAAAGSFLIDARPATGEDVVHLLESTDGWFLSETIRQHPDLARLHAETSNTARVITMRDPDGAARVFFAVLRIGTAATIPVDNGSRGGLVARIDLETGELSEARSLWSLAAHTHHPDTGTPIEGARIPLWPDVVARVLRAADALPYLQFIAWDVLVADDGPYIIEANTSSGVNIIQVWGPQRTGELGDFYRAHGVIR